MPRVCPATSAHVGVQGPCCIRGHDDLCGLCSHLGTGRHMGMGCYLGSCLGLWQCRGQDLEWCQWLQLSPGLCRCQGSGQSTGSMLMFIDHAATRALGVRVAPVRAHCWWCSRNQMPQARPKISENEHLQVKMNGIKCQLCDSAGHTTNSMAGLFSLFVLFYFLLLYGF